MATKNISRSSLEGGRYGYNKYERNASHRHERSRAREWLSNVRKDPEYADEAVIKPRDPVYKGFTDKLNPAYRFLASRCGRTWAEVHSELRNRFDVRSLQGFHILCQHVLAEVNGAGTEYDGGARWRHQRFYIDEDDILRDQGEDHWRHRSRKKYDGPRPEWVKNKIGKRRVFDNGETQWWAIPDDKDWVPCKHGMRVNLCHVADDRHRSSELPPSPRAKRYIDEGRPIPSWLRRFKYEHYDWSTWRRSRVFTEGEAKWWATISDRIKKGYIVGK